MEQRVTQIENDLKTLAGKLEQALYRVDDYTTKSQGELAGAISEVKGTTDDQIKNMQEIIEARILVIENEILQWKEWSKGIENRIGALELGHQNMIKESQGIYPDLAALNHRLQVIEGNRTGDSGSGSGGSRKSIMEYRFWENVRTLENDRTMYRDWRARFKGTYKQVGPPTGWREVLEYLESPEAMKKQEITSEDLKIWLTSPGGNAAKRAGMTEGGIMKMGEDLDVILQSKCGEKSQACTLWKRSKEDGILAYFWINVWYMSTSGEGITIRTTSLMNPTTSKKDEEVMYDVQKWLDDEREMEAMGIDRLGVDYRIAAVKRICTQM